MAGPSRLAQTGERAPESRDRPGVLLPALAATTLTLVVAQFALAGLGAFTMDKTPTDNAYGAHAVLGVVIGAMTWLTLIAVLASRDARAHRRTRWLAVALALLALPAEPLLGEVSQHVPGLGTLHALTGVAILALAGALTGGTARRRAAS
jgi:peptidoglycan/LPS O-acetylase OafA/YrhL